MIYRNNKKIVRVYKDNKIVNKIYKNNNIVYKRNGFTVIATESHKFTYYENGYSESKRKDVYLEANIPTFIEVIDNLTNTKTMFYNRTKIFSIDISTLDMSKATNISNMFHGCYAEIINLKGIILNNEVQTYSQMFIACKNVKLLDLSSFSPQTKSSLSMFSGCTSLEHIICTQAFKDWCIERQDSIKLPEAMREGGSGTWEIVD